MRHEPGRSAPGRTALGGRRPAQQDVGRKALTLLRTTGLFPWAAFSAMFVLIWAVTGAGYFWPVWPTLGWGVGVAVTGVLAHRLPGVYLERQQAKRC